MPFFLAQYVPLIAGALIAVGITLAGRRSLVALPFPAKIATAAIMVIALSCMCAFEAWGFFPLTWPIFNGEAGYLVLELYRFMFPLVVTAVALMVLLVPVRADGPGGSADLTRRTLWSFAPRPSLVFAATTAAVTVLATTVAGYSSRPDEDGRLVRYGVDASIGSASTTIYGWWFSLPCLALFALVIMIALTGLLRVSRPPLAADRAGDVARRTTRARGILAVLTGGLLFHVGDITQSLWAASSVRVGFQAEPGGWIELGSSFAAIAPALLTVSYVSTALGFALWLSVLLSAVSVRTARSLQPAGYVPR